MEEAYWDDERVCETVQMSVQDTRHRTETTLEEPDNFIC
jgi:hypothetical protein